MERNYDLLNLAWKEAARTSPNSTKAAAVLFDPIQQRPYAILSATNDYPDGTFMDPFKLERPGKYIWISHAERKLIAVCAKLGVPTKNRGIYLHWYPCADCARSILDAGIKVVVTAEPIWDDDIAKFWHFREASKMFEEAGIEEVYIK